MSSQDSDPTSPPTHPKIDPILRNALRYTISAKEYKTLHQYLIVRTPPAVRKRAPQPPRYSSIVQTNDDFNAAAVRASLRVFVASQTGLNLWDLIITHVIRRARPQKSRSNGFLFRSPNFRLSLSLSLILLLHRLLFRFFCRLRINLLTKEAAPFRRRNPRISQSLTSRLAPAIGASLAGFALGVYPADQLRITIAIYVAAQAVEFLYNALENDGWFKDKPWWWGSWMLMPLSTGQLLHAFVFDRDCFPKAYGDFILKNTPRYVQQRPASYPAHLSWPDTATIIDSLAEISRMNWPKELRALLSRIVRMTTFFTGAIGTSWGSICLFQYLFPRTFIPTRRWLLGGFLGGLWALVLEPGSARANGMYSVRMSVDSLWKVGRKRGWWKGITGGDLWVLVAGMAVLGGIYERDPGAVRAGWVRRGLGGLRGEGWSDKLAEKKDVEKDQ
ncbi:hypothetical protein MMC07_003423 [Pseudocyphellaria aurata]|nr:hypothetical protein [Pseudocyphellaria aurata]